MTVNEFLDAHYRANAGKVTKRIRYGIADEFHAEDVLHEAYERALRYFGSYDGSKEFDRWFSLIVRNAIRDHLRERDGFIYVDMDEYDHEGESCTGYYDKLYDEVSALIDAKADENHKEILHLHFDLGYSAIDISRVTDNTYANCRKIILRFRNQLKEIYKE